MGASYQKAQNSNPAVLFEDQRAKRGLASMKSGAIGSGSKSGITLRTGQDEPATQQYVDVIPNRQSMPEVQQPGTRTRKIPGPLYTDSAGEAEHVKITHGDASYPSSAKQTWKGAKSGYTTVEIPKYVPSPDIDTYQDTRPHSVGYKPTKTGMYTGRKLETANITQKGIGPEQRVKDHKIHEHKHGGEAKQVAGTTRDQNR